jgi:hypothetical protein
MESTKFTVPNDAKVLPNVLSKEEIKLILMHTVTSNKMMFYDLQLWVCCGSNWHLSLFISIQGTSLQNSKEKG